MKVIDKDLKISGIKCGVFQAYTDVEPELAVTPDTIKLTRVLPAPFFYEKRLYFFLVNRWEPGEKQGFPNGGFEVRDEGGALRSYDLDQVIIHPQLIKHKKTLDKMIRRAEKEAIAILANLRGKGQDPAAVIAQSIANGWTGLFPLKNQPTQLQTNNKKGHVDEQYKLASAVFANRKG